MPASSGLDQAALGKDDVGIDGARDVHLSVVAEDHKIRLFKRAGAPLGRVDHVLRHSGDFVQRLRYRLGKNAVSMARGVDVGRVQRDQIGFVRLDDIAGHGDDELVELRVYRSWGSAQQAKSIFNDGVIERLARPGAQQRLPHRLVRRLRPVFVYQIIDVRVVARNRPEDGRRRHPRFLGGGKQRL